MICIVGAGSDPEVYRVKSELTKLDCSFTSIDRKSRDRFSIEIGRSGPSVRLTSDGKDISNISVMWLYNKSDHALFGSDAKWAMEYIVGSSWHAVEFNLSMLFNSRIINPVMEAWRLSSKLYQLKVADAAGFNIPRSVVTNDFNLLEQKFVRNGSNIVKMLGNPHIPTVGEIVGQRAILTNDLYPSLILDRDDDVYPNPIYVQEKIVKKRELRIIVIGSTCFAFSIDANQNALMSTDYRRAGFAVVFEPIELQDRFSDRIVSLHCTFGLDFGCYDFIEKEDGEIVFLEVNPMGIWSYHDDLVDGAISRAIAKYLQLAQHATAADKM